MIATGMVIRRSFVAAFMAATGAAAAQVNDFPQVPKTFFRGGNDTSQPIGHYEFCRNNKSECREKDSNPVPVKMNADVWRLINRINDQVNKDITPMNDIDIFGKDEVWAYPDGVGDCEDYALEKRRRLMQAGIRASSLLMTVVRQQNGEGHAVLTVRTDKGDFILDNLEASILPMDQTGYTFLKRISEYHSGKWVTIEPSKEAPPETAAANPRINPAGPGLY